jgi:cytochrome c oxidase assembly factor CtaG
VSYVTQHWAFDPFLIVVIVIVTAHETGLSRLRQRSDVRRTKRRRRRALLFYAGLACLLLAVESPIDYWSDEYFFVHMIEHILISFYAPILIVAGAPWIPLLFALPVAWRRRLVRFLVLSDATRPLRSLGALIRSPWTALISFNAVMVLWHLPVLFDLAENNGLVHIWLMHGSFLVTGILFWLQIIPSHPMRPRASLFWQGGAVVSTNVVMFILAMSLSIFSSASWYPVYAHVPGVTLPPFADQQIGAAILWVCGDFWAYPALIVILRRAIVEEGSLSNVLERMVHRLPAPRPAQADHR